MTRHRQRSECSKVAAVLQGQKAERNDDEEDGFLVNMPSEEKRSVAAECDGADKVVPRRPDKQFEQSRL